MNVLKLERGEALSSRNYISKVHEICRAKNSVTVASRSSVGQV